MSMNPRLLRPRASGGGFDPRSIANLALWLDATVDSSLTFNGNTVSEWRDLSGNGRHFSQATAAKQPNGTTRTMNGRRTLEFGGPNQTLVGNASTLTIAQNISAVTIVCVARPDVTGQLAPIVHISRQGSPSQARALLGADNTTTAFRAGGRRTDADSFVAVNSGSNTLTTQASVLTGVYDYGNSDIFIYLQGSLSGSNTNFQTDGNTTDTPSDYVAIANTGLEYFDGEVSEVVVYQRALPAAERLTIERYLGAKWGIAVA